MFQIRNVHLYYNPVLSITPVIGSRNVSFTFVQVIVAPDLFSPPCAVYRAISRMIIYVSLVRNVWKPVALVLAEKNRIFQIQLGPAEYTPTAGIQKTIVSTSDSIHISIGYLPSRTAA